MPIRPFGWLNIDSSPPNIDPIMPKPLPYLFKIMNRKKGFMFENMFKRLYSNQKIILHNIWAKLDSLNNKINRK